MIKFVLGWIFLGLCFWLWMLFKDYYVGLEGRGYSTRLFLSTLVYSVAIGPFNLLLLGEESSDGDTKQFEKSFGYVFAATAAGAGFFLVTLTWALSHLLPWPLAAIVVLASATLSGGFVWRKEGRD